MRKWHIPYIVGMLLVMVVVWFAWIQPDIEKSLAQDNLWLINTLMYFCCIGLLLIIIPISATFKYRNKE